MKAELITIGDEILIGQIVDTNSTWISRKLIDLGIDIWQIRSISDKKEDIINAIRSTKADLVIITGGLGPTSDDLTKHTLAEYFNSKLVLNNEVLAHIEQLLVGRGVVVNDMNREQALLPDNAEFLENISGTAAGMWFEKDNKHFISLPGVPFEMKGIMRNEVIPRLIERFNTSAILYRTIMTQGLPESMLAMKIKSWEEQLPNEIKLAYLPRPGIVRLRLTAEGDDKRILVKIIEKEIKKLYQIIPQYIYAFEDIPLEKVVADLLIEQGLTVSTAESCTGGQISSMLTSISGSSAYYHGSIISYSNSIKNKYLEVPLEVLIEEGAVSKKVVEQMSKVIREKLTTNLSIAVSGIAGPDGGTKDKPVGTVWISVSSDNKTVSKKFLFGEDRGRNITRASLSALNMLRLFILNKI